MRSAGALRAGDETGFITLSLAIMRMLRLAESFVPTDSARRPFRTYGWVWSGIHRFEGRSMVKTWLFRILVNRAKATGASEPQRGTRRRRRSRRPFPDASGHWNQPPEPGRPSTRLDANDIAERYSACRSYPTGNDRCWCCATSKESIRRTCVTCSESPLQINGCCCTGRVLTYAGFSNSNWGGADRAVA